MSGEPIILFDGHCNVCSAWVRFVLTHERASEGAPRLRFASLQSPAGERLLTDYGLPTDVRTIVLIDPPHAFIESTAVLRIMRRLRAPWPLLSRLLAIPRVLRDPIYRFVARRRYQWFGRREQCFVPTPAVKERFL